MTYEHIDIEVPEGFEFDASQKALKDECYIVTGEHYSLELDFPFKLGDSRPCPECGGAGWVQNDCYVAICPSCQGTGEQTCVSIEVVDKVCEDCHDNGYYWEGNVFYATCYKCQGKTKKQFKVGWE